MKSTEKRILVFAFLILAGTVAANTLFHLQAFQRTCFDGLILRCQSAASGLKGFVETNLERGLPLQVLQELDDRCRQIVGNDPDLAYCLVEDDRGHAVFSSNPAFDVRAVSGSVASLSINTTRLDLPALGKTIDYSTPLYAADGRLVGRVRIGFAEAVMRRPTMHLLQQAAFVLGGALLGVLGLVVIFTRRHLLTPVRRLSEVATEIAGGNFTIDVPSMPSREFNELANSLREMAASLAMRDDLAARNYSELEQANALLQQVSAEQEKTSRELSRSQTMYRTLFENASDAIVITDHEENILLFNKRAEEFFGVSRDQVLGNNFFKFVAKIRGDVHRYRYFHAELQVKGRVEKEIRFVRTSDDSPVIGWCSAAVVQERNGKFWVQHIVRDVTRESRLKENLEQSARELKRLNQMKDSFLGLASHELKTPLTVIVGYSDLLLNDPAVTADESARSMVQHIADAAERLTGIVHDMVDVSMLDSCRLPLSMRPVDVNVLLRDVTSAFDDSLMQRRQGIGLQLQEDLPIIEADSGRLRQAISNLVGNAIKFTPDGGRIVVESRLFEGEGGGEKKVEIRIADTGIGIAESDHEDIFQKFYEGGQIEEHFTAKVAFRGKGTGLGLTIAKGIVDMHGGRIWVESSGYDPVRCPGSVFHVLLPVRQPSAASAGAGLSCG